MSFDICFDKECSSLMIRNIDELWFTPSDVVYDVEPYNGIFKRTSVNMDVVVPVDDFKDYAYTYSNVFIDELNIKTNNE
ncbi:MAG: hypothetical protein ACI388_07060 [Methanobrevibacter sp.]|uniref:hypothetical protein n=1 Tax=Methanobrevibacter sp. TaxID=66852 RepID=UPI003F08CAC7